MLFRAVLAQRPSCGQHQCNASYAFGEDYDCWDRPNPATAGQAWTSKAMDGTFGRDHWLNCSAILGPNFKFVNRSRSIWKDKDMTSNMIVGASVDFCRMDYFAVTFRCTGTRKDCQSDNDCAGSKTCDPSTGYVDWLNHQDPVFLSMDRCTNMIERWLCLTNVAPFDIDGRANHYALRSHVVYGPSHCRSFCEELWDACELHNKTNADRFRDPLRLLCKTPSEKNELDPVRFGTSSDDSKPEAAACFHNNGSVSLPKCSFMPFQCKNGGVFGPTCEGCLCPPGFGGADCSRCSSDEEMWPSVRRDVGDYSGKHNGQLFASAACAFMHGDSSNGPVGDGPLVNTSLHTCTTLTHLRPVPSYIRSNASKNSSARHVNASQHADAERLNNNSSINSEFLTYDCAYESDGTFDKVFTGGFVRLHYGIRASPSCFKETLGGWDSPDCTLNGNLTLRLIKQIRFNDGFSHPRPKHPLGYNPTEIVCEISECHQGMNDDCGKNGHLPKDYSLPCVKCEFIKCWCPENAFIKHTTPGGMLPDGMCLLDLLGPEGLTTTGLSSSTYIGCSESSGECSVFSSAIPGISLNFPYCRSSSCADIPDLVPATPLPTWKLEFWIVLTCLSTVSLFSCLHSCAINVKSCFRIPRRYLARCQCIPRQSTERAQRSGVEKITSETDTFLLNNQPQSSSDGSSGEHHSLVAENITYVPLSTRAQKNDESRPIVSDLSMTVDTSSGGVMAIQGVSGCGKSTFVEVLVGRKKDLSVKGKVVYDGRQLTPTERQKLFGYVHQHEAFIGLLTVRETLQFALNLRVSSQEILRREKIYAQQRERERFHANHDSKAAINQKGYLQRCQCVQVNTARQNQVNRIISMLGLNHIADSYVGGGSDFSSLRGISGGERKRVAIGLELIVEPPVLVCDEPTTGLDAASAKSVMSVLTDLVQKHKRIVICTLHQPRSDIYAALGGVSVLSPEGTMLYSGPAGQEALSIFESASGHKCPKNFNAADFILDAVVEGSSDFEKRTKWQEMASKQNDRFLHAKKIEQSHRTDSGSNRNDLMTHKRICSLFMWPMYFCMLYSRSSKQLFRSPTLVVLHYVVPLISGVLFGLLYDGITPDISGIINYAGSFFCMQVFWCLISMSSLDLFASNSVVVAREIENRSFSIVTYYLSRAINDLITLRALPVLFFTVPFAFFSGIGSQDFQVFIEFSTILVLTSIAFTSICIFIGSACQSSRVANAFGVLVMIFSLLFGGLLVNHNSAILDAKWYESLFLTTPLYYAYESLMIIVLQGADIDFDPKGFNIHQKTDGGVWLANFGMHAKNKGRDMFALVYFSVSFFLCGTITMVLTRGVCTFCAVRILSKKPSSDDTRAGHSQVDNPESLPPSVQSNSEPLWVRNCVLDAIETKSNSDANSSEIKEEHDSSDRKGKERTLVFNNLSARIGNRDILSSVSACASTKDGGVFAITGASGSGKTTLLDIIAGRKNVGRFAGTVSVDGIAFSSVLQRRHVFGYVMQDEALLDVLTVRETLTFAASLRWSHDTFSSRSRKLDAMVSRVLRELKLEKVAHSLVGSVNTFRGISGGERKRVAIGMELVADPPVLLLDEPTTGLDANSAASVMQSLRKLVLSESRRTLVICTIHQPRSDIFHELGRVMMLRPLSEKEDFSSRSGKTSMQKSNIVYCGKPSLLEPFLLKQGYKCPPGVNVADFCLDLIADRKLQPIGNTSIGNSNTGENESRRRRSSFDIETSDFADLQQKQEYHEQSLRKSARDGLLGARIQLCCSNYFGKCQDCLARAFCFVSPFSMTPWELNGERIHYEQTLSSRACGCCIEFGLLMRIEVLRVKRNYFHAIVAHIAVALVSGLLFGFLYYDLQPNTVGVWNRRFGIFAQITLFSLLGLSAVGTWQSGRLRFLRQRSSGYYGTLSYYMSRWLFDAMTLRVFPVCIFVLSSYDLMGLSAHYDSEFVNTAKFFNSSGCRGIIQDSGSCANDPLAVDGNDLGAWGRSRSLCIGALTLVALSSSSIASFITSCSSSPQVANFITVLIILILLMFSGAMVSPESMGTLSWIQIFNPFALAFEAMNIGSFQNQCFLFNPTTMDSILPGKKREALACVEVPGYKWMIQFGCTPLANRTSWGDYGNTTCHYDYATISYDLECGLVLLVLILLLTMTSLALCLKERR